MQLKVRKRKKKERTKEGKKKPDTVLRGYFSQLVTKLKSRSFIY